MSDPPLDLIERPASRASRPPRDVALTRRQNELLVLVAAGHSNAEIAKALCLSGHTVRKHLENIFQRLGVTNRTAAVAEVFSRSAVGHGPSDERWSERPVEPDQEPIGRGSVRAGSGSGSGRGTGSRFPGVGRDISRIDSSSSSPAGGSARANR
jgi:DNA-binding CsgD family transcriptional regulator